jgi:thermostable 8-oxoguanine DNA glycosylase
MPQTFDSQQGRQANRPLPDANETVLPGVLWGEPETLFTPAYWLTQMEATEPDQAETSPFKSQESLPEEIVFCLLGGYGVPAETALAYYQSGREAGLIADTEPSVEKWRELLQTPVPTENGIRRYRYPNKKSEYIVGALRHVRANPPDLSSGKALRRSLLKIKGIGLKTASWIARNCLDCDDVAILDAHLIRACRLCDLFPPEWKVERDYLRMEERFLQFCQALEVRPSVLDCLIWSRMRQSGQLPLRMLEEKQTATQGF